MKTLFLDESGDHNLSKIGPEYPIFVLGGVIVEDYDEHQLTERLSEFKRDMFRTTDIILHTADITRNRNGFEALQDSRFRDQFRDRLNELMRTLSYSVVACAIQKKEHLGRHGATAPDPYMLSLETLVERFCFDIGDANKGGVISRGGVIVAEKRGPALDQELEFAWSKLKSEGTYCVSARDIEERILGLDLRSKRDNIAGLQLADLVVSPIGRHIMGKRDHEDWEIVNQKFCISPETGQSEGYGLVILPK